MPCRCQQIVIEVAQNVAIKLDRNLCKANQRLSKDLLAASTNWNPRCGSNRMKNRVLDSSYHDRGGFPSRKVVVSDLKKSNSRSSPRLLLPSVDISCSGNVVLQLRIFGSHLKLLGTKVVFLSKTRP